LQRGVHEGTILTGSRVGGPAHCRARLLLWSVAADAPFALSPRTGSGDSGRSPEAYFTRGGRAGWWRTGRGTMGRALARLILWPARGLRHAHDVHHRTGPKNCPLSAGFHRSADQAARVYRSGMGDSLSGAVPVRAVHVRRLHAPIEQFLFSAARRCSRPSRIGSAPGQNHFKLQGGLALPMNVHWRAW